MKKYAILMMIPLLCWMAFLLPGCGQDSSDRGPTFPAVDSAGATSGSSADVRLSFVIDGTSPAPSASVLAATTGVQATVTVRLISVNCGDTATPTTKFTQTSAVGTSGRVEFSFSVPAKTTVAQVSIDGGTISGYSDFQGAADLVAGSNVIVVNPVASRLPSDLTAQLIMQLVNSPNMFAKAPSGLAAKIRAVTAGLDTRAATIYYDAINLISQRVLGMDGGWTGTGSATTGIGITWKGALAAAPALPMLNWVYYNTTDHKSYIWNGSAWDVMAQDGATGLQGLTGATGTSGTNGTNGTNGTSGTNGTNGVDGTDGVGISWKGSLSAAPSNPLLNWVYYNTTNGTAYIFDGSIWQVMVRDGATGVQGPAGTNGTNGISIVWQGSYADEVALIAAKGPKQINWAYYNTTAKQSYLWAGTTWVTFVPTGDNVAPTVSAVSSQDLGGSSVQITWNTNEQSTSQVEFGSTTGYGSLSTVNEFYTQSHSVTLTGLTLDLVYNFRVRSKDSSGNEGISSNATFVLPGDHVAPTISHILDLEWGLDAVQITWDTDEPSTSQVEYGPSTDYGSLSAVNESYTQHHSVILPGVRGTACRCRVRSKDSSGNEGISDDYSFYLLL